MFSYRIISALIFAGAIFLVSSEGRAQSTEQTFPTPVRTNEIGGSIKARDVGDARLTTYFYTFEAEQGDLFINVQSTNFTGDIDVFVTQGLRPLTKVVMYADISQAETGRVIYLRKPETLLLRVQGRTPGDESAVFRIKFAGSFAASKLSDDERPGVPKVSTETESAVRVNSVGTIIEVVPKPKPEAKEVTAKTEETPEVEEKKTEAELVPEKKADAETVSEQEKEKVIADRPKPEVIITDPIVAEKKEEVVKPTPRSTRRNRRATAAAKKEVEKSAETIPSETGEKTVGKAGKIDSMANIRLVIYFKNGSTIERPMTEVTRFSVERATLTVISKDGSTGRYKMIDVVRVSIE